ncbi:hypothetical protein Y1Q_0020699 [Alligator mississippiensis]|uniref:Uncharacterized protein n=1 Tax=Alligator mississippiensis TaxID=8496 RepID=A0A151MUP0_ALLMI|nr:hypothetical protein Y1Q_0020699 [Alligator mississippiensis]
MASYCTSCLPSILNWGIYFYVASEEQSRQGCLGALVPPPRLYHLSVVSRLPIGDIIYLDVFVPEANKQKIKNEVDACSVYTNFTICERTKGRWSLQLIFPSLQINQVEIHGIKWSCTYSVSLNIPTVVVCVLCFINPKEL